MHLRHVFLIVLAIALASCASIGLGTDPQQAALRATQSGFVKEVDEPTSRGQLQKVSPDEMDVGGGFAVSPDGAFIVYSARQAAFELPSVTGDTPLFGTKSTKIFDIWKISIHGGAPVKITSGTSFDSWSPTFTSDGAFIVYESRGQIWKVRADGAGGKQKTPGSGTGQDAWPAVSSVNKIVFCSVDADNRTFIWTSNIDGGELTQLREGSTPHWSPDGLLIAFSFDNDVWVINSDGTNLVQLTSTSSIFEGIPSFSPDGKKITYISNQGKDGASNVSDFNVWSMNVDGSSKTQLTELSSWDSWPTWSSAGIYFLSARATGKSKYVKIWTLGKQ